MLKRADGSEVSYKAAAGAPGFDDIKAGDVIKVTVAEELAVFLGKNSVPAGAAEFRQTPHPPSGRRQAVAAETEFRQYTAKILAINSWNYTVTLQTADGLTKTIHVNQNINLADASVGDNVSVRATEAVVLLLEKP